MFQNKRTRNTFSRAVVLAALAFGTFVLLPAALQARLTTFSPGTGSPGAYALSIRQQYRTDAEHIIAAHPLVGIGVGNYYAGNPYRGTPTTDPHDVLLLQAAEGGYLFAVSFVLLIFGCVLALGKMRNVDIAPAAVGVLLATAVHGLVDVYWVRGTPIFSWLLVGMVCGRFVSLQRGDVRTART